MLKNNYYFRHEMDFKVNSRNQTVQFSLMRDIKLDIKREDEIHPYISGNKYRKLKYNISTAKTGAYITLLTFGGAYSNHIAATAFAGKKYGFKTIGIIRGEELAHCIAENATLKFAKQCGMQFKFISRNLYREKENLQYIDALHEEFGDFYTIPEGGTNALAIKGCEEILTKDDKSFDYICSAVGTGGTISGIINSTDPHQKVIGFSSLRGDFLKDEIHKWTTKNNWELNTDYHFGGYAKVNEELIAFLNRFKQETGVTLDPIYTGKMLFGIVQMAQKNNFKKGSALLAIHTGGLQGIAGMNTILKRKKLPLLL